MTTVEEVRNSINNRFAEGYTPAFMQFVRELTANQEVRIPPEPVTPTNYVLVENTRTEDEWGDRVDTVVFKVGDQLFALDAACGSYGVDTYDNLREVTPRVVTQTVYDTVGRTN